MRTFKITEHIEIVCESQKTRNGFRHIATLLRDGYEQEKGKCCYLNRTWERYEFQSVLNEVVNKAVKNKVISEEEEKLCKEFIDGDQTDWSGFKAVSMVAKLGEVFCQDKKEQNDWKARMIKAGLENKGLNMPEDWDTLSEEEKERRLNLVIGVLDKNDKL